MHILAAAILSAIVYPMIGLTLEFHFWLAFNVFGILVGASVMQMVGAVSRNFEEANILIMFVMILTMVMSTGFVREVPSWLEWLRSISMMGLATDLVMYYEFRNVDPKYGLKE